MTQTDRAASAIEPKAAPPGAAVTDPEGPLVDVMGGASRWTMPVDEHGFVALVDAMPRLTPHGQTADSAIVQAARVSYGAGTKRVHEDRGLIRYLLRHEHTTPFEMVEFKFHVAMPIFVARQWIRHRTASVNEYSGRYSVMPDRFYRPDGVRLQSAANRQGGEEVLDPDHPDHAATARRFADYLDRVQALYEEYEALVASGVSRELARIGLPTSQYTQWYWKCDLHNTLRFLRLRLDPHAQLEIRRYAQAMLALIEPIVPETVAAWRDYHLHALRLSEAEQRALADVLAGGSGELDSTNSRERAEWQAKLEKLRQNAGR